MYLFSRRRRIDLGHMTKAVEWSVEATGKVREITGREVDTWTAVMSPEVGTVVWTMWVETLAELEAAGDALAADAAFVKSEEKADDWFDGPMEDRVASMVHGTLDPAAPRAEYVAVVEGIAANGRLSNAIASGIAVAEFATRVGGQETGFLVNFTGAYGGVAWITGSPDIATVDASEAALMADPAWLDLVNSVGADYAPGVTSTLYRRLA